MDAAQHYLSEIDRILAAACEIFPDATSPAVTDVSAVSPAVQQGQGTLVDVTNDRSARYTAWSHQAAAAVESADLAAGEAASIASDGRVTAQGIRDRAQAEAQARGVGSSAPESLLALVSRMDDALARMQTHILTVQDDLSDRAQRMRSAAEDLSADPTDQR
jgi:ElaB/YqjD/DUF883 family membrane-anchored ribosome-binding protein